ncbi:MAG TPA: DNA-directed RNA polymerase subunit alpha [Candidatus Hydrogenedens sp.]|nr:DNA-directed RNA polymerase subunit alpha [Candidatus Hydrogenedens sp.]
MVANDFIIPDVVQFDPTSNDRYARIIVEPFERGYGITVGNSLRRVLLASLEGSAITAINIEGIYHEFSAIPGFKEDVTDLVLNLKRCQISLKQGDSLIFPYEYKGGSDTIYAKDLFEGQPVDALNPEHVIAIPVRPDSKLKMEIKVSRGRGYVPAEELELGHAERGTIYLDVNFSPVTKVNFQVEDARVGQKTDYDRLILEIWTNGSITPELALEEASSLLIEHLRIFVKQEKLEIKTEEEGKEEDEEQVIKSLFMKPVEQVEFPQRALNCFHRANIQTLGDLVAYTEESLSNLPNLGTTTIAKVKEILEKMGLTLGMEKEQTSKSRHRRIPIEFHEPGVQGQVSEVEDLLTEKMIEEEQQEN